MLGSIYVHPYNLAKFTWQFFRMSVADSILSLNGGYELVDQQVRRRRGCARPDLRLQVHHQLLIRRVELHPGRQAHPVLCVSNTNKRLSNCKAPIVPSMAHISAEKDLATKLSPVLSTSDVPAAG
jgi:hypothetical protein